MKLKQPMPLNRKAISIIYNDLLSEKRRLRCTKDENEILVTNGYVAFVFATNDFIFNANLLRILEEPVEAIQTARQNAIPLKISSFSKIGNGTIAAKLVSEQVPECPPIFIDNAFLEMFSNECALLGSQDPCKPVLVQTHYGKDVGVIMPIRLNDTQIW